MNGTIVNVIAIIAGGAIGCILKKGIKKSIEESLYKALGLAVLIIGLNGVISNMLSVSSGGTISSRNDLLMVISLAVGTLIGEWGSLDRRVEAFSNLVEKKFSINGFSEGFISASTIFCVGAMAIIGSINDGVLHDSSVLYTKSMLDFTVAMVLASTFGVGVIFSAIPVLIYQGGITLFASFLQGYLVGELLSQVCMVGYCLVMVIGINFIFNTKIKTVNMLPAILIPVIYDLILKLFRVIN